MKDFITAIIIHSILENLLQDLSQNLSGAKIDEQQAEVNIDGKQQPLLQQEIGDYKPPAPPPLVLKKKSKAEAVAVQPDQQEQQLPQDQQLSPSQQRDIQKQKEENEREMADQREKIREGVFKQPPSGESAFPFINKYQSGGDITKDTKIQCKLYQTVLDIISSFDLDDKPPESLRDILIKVINFMATDKFADSLKEKWYKATESGYDGGSSSSKSKKNKKSYKSHKSYHPKIGKTRKHHNTHNKPKRVSFVHQA
jgi:hypothetical protein